MGSVIVAHGPSCPKACGIFPDQGSNLCPLTGRRILSHQTARKVPLFFLMSLFFLTKWPSFCPPPPGRAVGEKELRRGFVYVILHQSLSAEVCRKEASSRIAGRGGSEEEGAGRWKKKKEGAKRREARREAPPSGMWVLEGILMTPQGMEGMFALSYPNNSVRDLMPLEGTTWTCPVDGLKPLSLRSPLALKMEPGLPEALPVPGWPSLRLLP